MQNAYEMGKKTITKKYPNKSSDIATCGTPSVGLVEPVEPVDASNAST